MRRRATVTVQPTVWSYIRLLLCLASAYLVALLFSEGAADPVGVWATVLGNWLAIWLFFELRPLRAEQYSARMLLGIFKYGPLALFLFFFAVSLLSSCFDALCNYIQPAAGAATAIAYTRMPYFARLPSVIVTIRSMPGTVTVSS